MDLAVWLSKVTHCTQAQVTNETEERSLVWDLGEKSYYRYVLFLGLSWFFSSL